MNIKTTLAIVTMIVSVNGFCQTTEQQAIEAVEQRKALFNEIAEANKPIALMLRRQATIDPDGVITNGQKLIELSEKIPQAYEINTQGFNVETRALNSIWANVSDFESKAQQLRLSAEKLVDAGKTGNETEITKALMQVGRSCGNCHDSYRSK